MKKHFLLFLFLGIIALGFSQTNKPQESKNDDDKKKSEKVTEHLFLDPEEMPQFPGGEVALFKFIKDNLKYPQSAIDNGIEGTVYVSFIVEADSTLSDIKILRGIHPDCDAEVIRVLKLSPKWIPIKQKGTAVRVQLNMPVKFVLPKKEIQE